MTVRILQGDARDVLKTLPDESVHCVVTSPPYWGLRDYGVAGQLGLERTPDEYVSALVGIFHEVRRVLRSDGTAWLNLGDTFAASGRGGNPTKASSTLEGGHATQEASMPARRRGSTLPAGLHETARVAGAVGRAWCPPPEGMKRKDLVGVPWMVAFALRTDGWYLRQDIIWAKPNKMPESVKDRPSTNHEHIFLLAKSERYYYDAAAIAEPASQHERNRRLKEQKNGLATVYRLRRDQPHGQVRPGASGVARSVRARHALAVLGTRNRRSVWTVTTKPFREAHFATFPPDLIEPCVLAGCPAGGTVLDPFGGAGTTGLVAQRRGRNAILIELNSEYVAMTERRLGVQPVAEIAA